MFHILWQSLSYSVRKSEAKVGQLLTMSVKLLKSPLLNPRKKNFRFFPLYRNCRKNNFFLLLMN